jgi:C1A family cysteine protease
MIWPLKKRDKRGTGWLRDPHDPLQHPFYETPRTEEPPKSVDLSRHVVRILDQGNTSSCVAHAYAYAIMITESQARLPYEPISRLYLYSNARALTSDQKHDDGTYLRSGARALAVMGAPPEYAMPFDERKINESPGIGAHMLAHPRRGAIDRKILATGIPRINAVKRALEAGHPVTLGLDLERSFITHNDESVIEVPSSDAALIGGHAVCLCGYDEDGPEFPNSWTKTWGNGGFGRVSWEYIASPYCADLHIVTAWDRLREAFEARAEVVA